MSVARYYNQCNAGGSSAGLFGGGSGPSGKVATTEAFTGATTVTFTDSQDL